MISYTRHVSYPCFIYRELCTRYTLGCVWLWISNDPFHDDVIKWKHFSRYWPFVRGIHRSSVNSPHKGQWRGALMLSLICVGINAWVNNGEAVDLRRHRAHYDVTVMFYSYPSYWHTDHALPACWDLMIQRTKRKKTMCILVGIHYTALSSCSRCIVNICRALPPRHGECLVTMTSHEHHGVSNHTWKHTLVVNNTTQHEGKNIN